MPTLFFFAAKNPCRRSKRNGSHDKKLCRGLISELGRMKSNDPGSPRQPRSWILDPQSVLQAENSEVAFRPQMVNGVDVAET
jgi:hypothetical protein